MGHSPACPKRAYHQGGKMLIRLNAATTGLVAGAPEEMTGERPEINSHTFMGLGLMAAAIVVIWLIRRLRA